MDVIAAQEDVSIPVIFGPTRDAFLPRVEAHRAEIESIDRSTYRYGPEDRQQLDVYYPPADAKIEREKFPILFFFYGGGFVEGAKTCPAPYDILYANLGAFFAKRGFITVIPDYRLVPNVKFPEPVEDLRDAIAWIVEHGENITRGTNIQGDFENIFAMGHSAGSTYLLTMILYPNILSSDLRSRIRGMILTGGVYKFTPENPIANPDALLKLYGSWDDVQEKMPITLLQQASEELIISFPDTLVTASEREHKGIGPVNEEFVVTLRSKLGRDVPYSLMKGHNHLSPHWALWSGAGEEWAIEVEQWIKARLVLK